MSRTSALGRSPATGRPAPEAGDELLRAGMEVLVHGLLTRYDLNGLKGCLLDFSEQTGRWQVDLGEGPGIRRFHPCNLEPTDPAVYRAREDAREERRAAALEAERIVSGTDVQEASDLSSSAPYFFAEEADAGAAEPGEAPNKSDDPGSKIAITVYISRLLDISMEVLVPAGATILDVRKAVAVQDPLQKTQVDDVALGVVPQSDDDAPTPLPDDTSVTSGMVLECC